MLIARYAKIIVSLVLAAFCLLVAFDNITDYGTNYLFVQHVMSMDMTFPGNALMYRSITNPVLWHLAYSLIIAAEGITGILFLAGAIRLIQVRHARGMVFTGSHARRSRLVLRLHGGCRRVVRHVAVTDLERAGARLPLLHGGARRADLRRAARQRSRRQPAVPHA
jgi:hypothetical protein